MQANGSLKRHFAVAAVAALLGFGNAAQAECTAGPTTREIVWSTANGPHLLTSNFLVPADTRLVVLAGTEIRVAPGIGIGVAGVLEVEGQPGREVTFTAQNEGNGQTTDAWAGIGIHGPHGRARFNHARIRHAGMPGIPEFGAGLTVASPCAFEFINSSLSLSQRTGIFVDASPQGTPKFVNARIVDNAHHGILIYDSSAEIRDSLIDGNGADGFKNLHTGGYRGNRSVISNSDVTNNGGNGVFLFSHTEVPHTSQSYGHGNNITGNGGEQIAVFYTNYLRSGKVREGGATEMIDWSGNFFGELVFENGCPWSAAPPHAPRSYLSFDAPHLNHCEDPPEGPVSSQIHHLITDNGACNLLRCGVDQVRVTPFSGSRFPRLWDVVSPTPPTDL